MNIIILYALLIFFSSIYPMDPSRTSAGTAESHYVRHCSLDHQSFLKKISSSGTQHEISHLTKKQIKLAIFAAEKIHWDLSEKDSLDLNTLDIIDHTLNPVTLGYIRYNMLKDRNEMTDKPYPLETKWISNLIFSLISLKSCLSKDSETDCATQSLKLVGTLLADLGICDHDVLPLVSRNIFTLEEQKNLLAVNAHGLKDLLAIIQLNQSAMNRKRLKVLNEIYIRFNAYFPGHIPTLGLYQKNDAQIRTMLQEAFKLYTSIN